MMVAMLSHAVGRQVVLLSEDDIATPQENNGHNPEHSFEAGSRRVARCERLASLNRHEVDKSPSHDAADPEAEQLSKWEVSRIHQVPVVERLIQLGSSVNVWDELCHLCR